MAFDQQKWAAPAKNGDVAGIAIDTVRALEGVIDALRKVEKRLDINLDGEILLLQKNVKSLIAKFDEMTGWVKDGDN